MVNPKVTPKFHYAALVGVSGKIPPSAEIFRGAWGDDPQNQVPPTTTKKNAILKKLWIKWFSKAFQKK